jgi:hypothetical protein
MRILHFPQISLCLNLFGLLIEWEIIKYYLGKLYIVK